MSNLKYIFTLLGLHLINGIFAMMFCINAKFWIYLINEGENLLSIFTSAFIGIVFFACMMMTIFKTFYVWASRQKDPYD